MARSRGFTLIELLVVVLIIGVLAAIAVPRYRGAKQKAYFATLKSDLRNLATAQESYFQSYNTYYDGPIPVAGVPLTPSTGVTVTLSDVTQTGWAAVATHSAIPGMQCAVFYGTAAPVAPATLEGQSACQ